MLVKANLHDLNEIDYLAVKVIKDMQQANIPQWTLSYPRRDHYKKDIMKNRCYIYKEFDRILGVITVQAEDDPPYKTIDTWLSHNSLVIHRLIVHPKHQRKGIAKKLLFYAFYLGESTGYDSIKIDTHPDNYKMERFLVKLGFKSVGYLKTINRDAYEKLLEETNETTRSMEK
ncbi:MAG: GNAT family N-acetyltransferase [Candidatus Izimaplasma sp.]|nr:GNAT family N-acetyltransferase [Candidatus Izimaplasma bacterium]